ncbi:hypothetical protein [Bradyrhizobium sp. LTSP885]|uniref:hypothetical protein n=1 Tax=Bradyrhizobium sp. LTSP885 TaxID=1619232 RepID=UPI0012E04D15|nr:hypothetical protein [Bradyrhizobium sp. LTSP885]
MIKANDIEETDAERFDAAIERDAKGGKFDALAEEALAAHRAGQSLDLLNPGSIAAAST